MDWYSGKSMTVSPAGKWNATINPSKNQSYKPGKKHNTKKPAPKTKPASLEGRNKGLVK
jgi:hypothetical protein